MTQPIHFTTDQVPSKFGVGQPVRRVEDARLVTGHGRYVDDIELEEQTYGHVVRSPVAAAAVRAVNVAAAEQVPGVLLVLTAETFSDTAENIVPAVAQVTNRDGSRATLKSRLVLAEQRVRYAGEPVAFVVAETRKAARDAAEAIEVDYDIGEAVVGTDRAGASGGARVHEEIADNVAFEWQHGQDAEVDAAFASAAHVTRLDLVNNRVVCNSMETRAVNAAFDEADGTATVYAGTQGGWGLRAYLAERILKIDPDKVRVVTPDVGGGFGMKVFNYPEYALCALAARAIGRPVKWTGDRSESFVSDTQGRDHVTCAELALDEQDRILGLRVRTRANLGAYAGQFGAFIPTGAALKVLAGIYDVKVATYRVTGVYTNTTPVDAYRGAGRPESIYMIERLIDRAARERGLDPVAFRKANLIAPDAMPFRTVSGEVYDVGEFATVMDAAVARADVAGFAARREAARTAGKRLGLGIAYYIESTMGNPVEFADIRFEDGKVAVGVGTQSNGQGHETAYAQVVAEKLGVPFEAVQIVQGDTTRIPVGGGTGGSRSLSIQAEAIGIAGDEVVDKGRDLAADRLEAAPQDIEFGEGAFRIVGTDRSVDLLELADTHPGALDSRGKAEFEQWTFPNGCHVTEVEIDEATGAPRLTKYTIVDDFGRVVNPLLVAGQVHGGVVQGLGQALHEHTVYDDEGQLLSGSFMDYGMPRARDFPEFDFSYVEIPSKNNALGIKGCGEAGSLAAPPAAMNAICDALWDGDPADVPVVDMPALPESLWRLLQG